MVPNKVECSNSRNCINRRNAVRHSRSQHSTVRINNVRHKRVQRVECRIPPSWASVPTNEMVSVISHQKSGTVFNNTVTMYIERRINGYQNGAMPKVKWKQWYCSTITSIAWRRTETTTDRTGHGEESQQQCHRQWQTISTDEISRSHRVLPLVNKKSSHYSQKAFWHNRHSQATLAAHCISQWWDRAELSAFTRDYRCLHWAEKPSGDIWRFEASHSQLISADASHSRRASRGCRQCTSEQLLQTCRVDIGFTWMVIERLHFSQTILLWGQSSLERGHQGISSPLSQCQLSMYHVSRIVIEEIQASDS